VTSGRSAIALALQALAVSGGHQVLIPAYHCSSMVEPVIWVGAKPVFYRILPNVNVDLQDMESKITPHTRAVLLTHYFGFPQPSAAVRALCDRYGLALIEDCAHTFFGMQDGRPIGTYGDYSIASSMKFFPIYDGGILASARHDLASIHTESAGLIFNVKTAINGIEQSLHYGRLTTLKPIVGWPLALKDVLWRRLKSSTTTATIGPASSDGGYGFDEKWVNKQQSWFSRWMIRRTNMRRLVEKRRENYMRIHSALSGVTGGTPLFPELKQGVVPYVFPFVVWNPEHVFGPMKMSGIPILRFGEYLWDGVDERVCKVSADFSRRVFQFPCHQELTEKEIEWMTQRIKEILQQYGDGRLHG
jgi:perosamine synthetase